MPKKLLNETESQWLSNKALAKVPFSQTKMTLIVFGMVKMHYRAWGSLITALERKD